MQNHYLTLGLSANGRNANGDAYSQHEIRKAYQKYAALTHPDRNSSPSSGFTRVQIAYECLSDPKERTKFDEQRQQNPEAFAENKHLFYSIAGTRYDLTELIIQSNYNPAKLLAISKQNKNFAQAIAETPSIFCLFSIKQKIEFLIYFFAHNQLNSVLDSYPSLQHILENLNVEYTYQSEFIGLANQPEHYTVMQNFFPVITSSLKNFSNDYLINLALQFPLVIDYLPFHALNLSQALALIKKYPEQKTAILSQLPEILHQGINVYFSIVESLHTYKKNSPQLIDNNDNIDDLQVTTLYINRNHTSQFHRSRRKEKKPTIKTDPSISSILASEKVLSAIGFHALELTNSPRIKKLIMVNLIVVLENEIKTQAIEEDQLIQLLDAAFFILTTPNFETLNETLLAKMIPEGKPAILKSERMQNLLRQIHPEYFLYLLHDLDQREQNYNAVPALLTFILNFQHERKCYFLELMENSHPLAIRILQNNQIFLRELLRIQTYIDFLKVNPNFLIRIITKIPRGDIETQLYSVNLFKIVEEKLRALQQFSAVQSFPNYDCFKELYAATSFFQNLLHITTHCREIILRLLIDMPYDDILYLSYENRLGLHAKLITLFSQGRTPLENDTLFQIYLNAKIRPFLQKNLELWEHRSRWNQIHFIGEHEQLRKIYLTGLKLKIFSEGYGGKIPDNSPVPQTFWYLTMTQAFNQLSALVNEIRNKKSIEVNYDDTLNRLIDYLKKSGVDLTTLEILIENLKTSHPDLLQAILYCLQQNIIPGMQNEFQDLINKTQADLPTIRLESRFFIIAEHTIIQRYRTIFGDELLTLARAWKEAIFPLIRSYSLQEILLNARILDTALTGLSATSNWEIVEMNPSAKYTRSTGLFSVPSSVNASSHSDIDENFKMIYAT